MIYWVISHRPSNVHRISIIKYKESNFNLKYTWSSAYITDAKCVNLDPKYAIYSLRYTYLFPIPTLLFYISICCHRKFLKTMQYFIWRQTIFQSYKWYFDSTITRSNYLYLKKHFKINWDRTHFMVTNHLSFFNFLLIEQGRMYNCWLARQSKIDNKQNMVDRMGE